MAQTNYVITYGHLTQLGNLKCRTTASVTVEGEDARDRLIAWIADTYKCEAIWEHFHGDGVVSAANKVRAHFENFPIVIEE